MILHLNKKHVLFQVERSEEILKTEILVTTNKTSPAELKKKHFWNVLNVVMESLCSPFGENAQYFSERSDENHQNNFTQYKRRKTTFPKINQKLFL